MIKEQTSGAMRKQTDERYEEKRGLVVGVGQQMQPGLITVVENGIRK
jgi:hypothetical protein